MTRRKNPEKGFTTDTGRRSGKSRIIHALLVIIIIEVAYIAWHLS